MSPVLYLFIPNLDISSVTSDSMSVSWVYKDSNNNLKTAKGALKDVAIIAPQYNITVVLPGENILHLTAEVPGKNPQRVQQAIPYVLEDSVIDDVDNLHFAVNKKNNDISDNIYQTSVINKQYFNSVVGLLKNEKIQIDIITADYLLLEKNTIFFDGERIIFHGAELKFSTNIETLGNFYDHLLDEKSVKVVLCGKNAEENIEFDALINKYKFNKEICSSLPQVCLIKNSSPEYCINFLQGQYKKKKDWSQTGKTWLPAAALFLIWVIVQGGLFISDYIGLSKQNKRLNTEITEIYKKTFPQSRRIIDAKAQMQQKLNSLRKRKGQSGRAFTEMLAASAGIFSKTKGLKIKSLRYYDGRINLELQLTSLQSLDKLKNQLIDDKGYKVEIQNVSSGKDNVTARIQIIGAAL